MGMQRLFITSSIFTGKEASKTPDQPKESNPPTNQPNSMATTDQQQFISKNTNAVENESVSKTGALVAGKTGALVAGKTGALVAGKTGDLVAGKTGALVAGKTGDLVAGKTGALVAGKTGALVEGTAEAANKDSNNKMPLMYARKQPAAAFNLESDSDEHLSAPEKDDSDDDSFYD